MVFHTRLLRVRNHIEIGEVYRQFLTFASRTPTFYRNRLSFVLLYIITHNDNAQVQGEKQAFIKIDKIICSQLFYTPVPAKNHSYDRKYKISFLTNSNVKYLRSPNCLWKLYGRYSDKFKKLVKFIIDSRGSKREKRKEKLIIIGQ